MQIAPVRLNLARDELAGKVRAAEEMLRECRLCPHECRVDRMSGKTGICRTGDKPHVDGWGPHFGEEKPLVGRLGSGTIFFSQCNLRCIFCQNWRISHLGEGDIISFQELAVIMMEIQRMGCRNINLVTPTHQMPMILRAIAIATDMGMNLPILYNCGGYESLEALKVLSGVIDIYMPDFKYSESGPALKYSKAADYPESAKAAIREMHRQVGDLIIDERGIALKGLLVRHLVLPENTAGTNEIVRFIAEEISKETYLNIMDQFHPCYKASECPPLDRRITENEYAGAVEAALKAGLKRIDGHEDV